MKSPIPRLRIPLLAAAAALAGCASSDRMMRVSPMSEPEVRAAGGRKGEVVQTLRDDRVNTFPLYYANGAMHSVLWPFIDWDDRGFAFRPFYNRDGKNASVLFPLSGWDDKSGWALNTIWDEKGWLFLPLAGDYAGTHFVGPAFWRDDGARGLFPVWYQDKDTFWLAELYASSRDGGLVTRRSLLGLPYYSKWDEHGDGFTWAFPLGAWGRAGESDWMVTAPFSRGKDARGSFFNVHPLWWSGEYKDGSSYSGLLPLWFHSRGEGRSSTVTPLYSARHDASGSWLNVHPLWWSAQRKDGSGRSMLLPLWYESHSQDYRSVISPLYSAGHDDSGSWLNVHPLWWSSERKDGSGRSLLVPLWYETHSAERRSVISPLYSAGHDPSGSWLNIHPLWWSSKTAEGSERAALIPFWFHTGKGSTEETVSLFYTSGSGEAGSYFNVHPLWWSGKDPAGGSYSSLLPLWYESSGKDRRALLTPLYSYGHNEGGSWMNVHPLWWSGTTKDGDAYASLLPLWYSSAGEGRREVITPLFSRGDLEGRSWFNVHPLWWSAGRADGSSWSTLVPLWYHTTDAAGGASTLSPFFSAGHDAARSWLNVHPLWWSSSNADGSGRQLMIPLWYRVAQADGSVSTLSPLHSAGHDAESSWLNVHPLWWSTERKDGSGRSMLLPLWYTATDAGGGVSTVSPLFSRGHDAQSSWMNIHPLWWSGEYKDGSSYSALLPLWWRMTDAEGRGSTISPLYSRGTNASGGSFFNIHPLWWSGGDKDSGYSMLLPLWWSGHGPEGSGVISPLGARFADAKGDATLLNALGVGYHAQKAPDGRYAHVMWPLWTQWAGDSEACARPVMASIASRATGGESSAFRITPLVSTESKGTHEEWREWAHLVSVHDTASGGHGFSATPLVVHRERGADSDTRVFPFFDSEVRGGERSRLSVRPFYVTDPSPGLLDHLTHVWVRTESDWREIDRCLLFFGRSITRELREGALGRIETRENFGPLHTSSRFTDRVAVDDSKAYDLRILDTWRSGAPLWRYGLREEDRPAVAEDASDPMSRYRRLEPAETSALVSKILVRLGRPASADTDEARREAAGRALASGTRVDERRRFAVDPLWIPLFKSESGEKDASWELLFGVAHGENDGTRSRTSVLRYLYNRERGPDGTRMNCFPFVSADNTTKKKSVSFLWRVFHHETDKSTGKSSGHLLFIPY